MTGIEGRRLARFRADPTKVSIRQGSDEGALIPTGWFRVVVVSRDPLMSHRTYSANASTSIGALVATLELAHEDELDGIDLGMEWAYKHPFGGRIHEVDKKADVDFDDAVYAWREWHKHG